MDARRQQRWQGQETRLRGPSRQHAEHSDRELQWSRSAYCSGSQRKEPWARSPRQRWPRRRQLWSIRWSRHHLRLVSAALTRPRPTPSCDPRHRTQHSRRQRGLHCQCHDPRWHEIYRDERSPHLQLGSSRPTRSREGLTACFPLTGRRGRPNTGANTNRYSPKPVHKIRNTISARNHQV